MVDVLGDYGVFATETSNADYAQFLAIDYSPDYEDLTPAECDWKADYIPGAWADDLPPNLPVTRVDWCDASAYCHWAGGRLCGAVGGGPSDIEAPAEPLTNEWYRACTNVGVKEYPYGILYNPDACNTLDFGAEELVEVGSLPDCEGGLAGIFDMSGNVWEWTNACNDVGEQDQDDECRRRGGSYFSGINITQCGVDSIRPRGDRNPGVGFRCCM